MTHAKVIGWIVGSTAVLLLGTMADAQDAYLCYQAKSSKVPAQAKFTGVEINLVDQFQPGGRNYLASKHGALCNPTSGASSPDVHHVELQIKDSKANPNASKFVAPTATYLINDAFVTDLPLRIVKPSHVRVRSSKDDYGVITKCKLDADCSDGDTCQSGRCLPVSTTPPAPPATAVDNFTCYKVKLLEKPLLPLNVGITDQFGNFGNYDLKKFTRLCAPANKDGETPGAENHPGHLACYQAKPVKGAPKFLARGVVVNNTNIGAQYLDVKKATEICVHALKTSTGPTPTPTPVPTPTPTPVIPTQLTLETDTPGGVCGSLTTNTVGEGVPLRLDPSNATADPNAVCTASGVPKACCTAAGQGHCDEGNTVVCGSLSFGGGGPSVGSPGGEGANNAGGRTRYSLSCPSATGVCTIAGDAGDLPNGVNCSTAGCGITTPIESTSPVKVCAISKLGAAASGSLDLATGEISLANATNANVFILTSTSSPSTACPRCRTTTSTASPAVFATGPGSPGIGVCDTDATNDGDTCYVFEPSGPTAGLSSNCTPTLAGGGSATISIATTSTTAGDAVSDPAGHFCPGQAGNADCVGPGNPNACCSGPGTGGCSNFNGCFGSGKYADTPALCTAISVTGSAAGPLVVGTAPVPGTFGDVACIPGVASGSGLLDGLVNGNAGLPGPVVTSTKVLFRVD